MADLTSIEKVKLEKMFGMSSGYVLDFSNRTFQEFIAENTGLDIDNSKYDYASNSKANRLRAFWKIENNYIVGNLIEIILEHWRTYKVTNMIDVQVNEQTLFDECLKISKRLKSDVIVEQIDAIQPNNDDRDFSILAKSIKDSIQKNEPETALDRLHTFTVKYIRQLCDKYGVEYDKNTPLHSLFGGYVKHLTSNSIIESEMTERILKSSISVLEAFNKVRNEQSFAHDNPILNYDESLLIFNDIANVLKFIEVIEKKTNSELNNDKVVEDLPF